MSIELKQAAQMSLEALEEIALAGMSGTGQESEEGMRDWHARQAWKFIGIAARALDPLRTAIQQAAESEPVEISPEFTDTARAALLWVLWHHQGGSSPVGQPIRYALGIGAHDHLNDHQVIEAKRWASITGAQASEFHTHPDPGVPDDVVRDAERYRWLLCNYLKFHLPDEAWKHGSLDAAIDAAMLAAKEGGAA